MPDNFQGCQKLTPPERGKSDATNSVYDSWEGMPDKVGASSVGLFPRGVCKGRSLTFGKFAPTR